MSQPLKDLNLSVAQVEEMFFLAMLAGYASDGDKKIKRQDLIGMSGYKFTEFIKNNFRVVDAWCKTSGFTSIWYKDILVWTMNYGGHYEKTCIAFLKSVLKKTYSQKIFCGGRGVAIVNGTGDFERFMYANVQLANNDFKRFTGSELILDCGRKIGSPSYLGGLVY